MRRTRHSVIGGIALIFVLRAAYTLITVPDAGFALNTDRWGTIARNLASGHGYTYPYYLDTSGEPFAPTAYRVPVPVLLFAALVRVYGYSLAPIVIAQWLLDCATGYLIYQLAGDIFHSSAIGLIALFGFAIYVPEITFTDRALSEPVFTFLLIGACLCLVRATRQPKSIYTPAAGLLLGLSTLSQPIAMLFVGIVLLAWLYFFRNLAIVARSFAVLAVTFSFALLPWIIRNYLVFHELIPTTTNFGINLIVDNYNLGRPNFIQELGATYGVDKEAAMVTDEILARQGRTSVGMSASALDRVRVLEALRLIALRPDRYILLCGYRFLRLWFNVGYGSQPSLQSYLVLILNAGLLGLALMQMLIFRGARLRASWPVIGLIVYFTVSYSLIHGQVRYIMPVMPYVILLASASVAALFQGRMQLGGTGRGLVRSGGMG